MKDTSEGKFHFSSRYLELSLPGRLFLRFLSYIIYSALMVSALIFFFSLSTRLMWGSTLILLFLVDRFLQHRIGERTIDSRIFRKIEQGREINVAPYFNAKTIRFLERALTRSKISGNQDFRLILLDELSRTTEVKLGLLRLEIDNAEFSRAIAEKLKGKSKMQAGEYPTLIKEICILSFKEALDLGEVSVSPSALFLGLLSLHSDELLEIFAKFNFKETDFRNAIVFGRLISGLGKRVKRRIAALQGSRRIPHRIMNRAWTSRPTHYLDSIGQDLTDLARAGFIGFLVGHEAEYHAMLNVLSREAKNNALLLGPAGIGKETIIGHLAYKITRDEVPKKLFDKRLVLVNITAITSGTKTAGEVHARLEMLIDEVLKAGNIILYFPDIENLKFTAQEGISALEVLKPIFASSLIPVIATSTPQGYRALERDQSFVELFEVIRVEELSEEEAISFLTYESYILESKWKILISYGAIREAVKLAKRYLHDKPLPSSAIDLLQEALADAKNRKLKALSERDVLNIVSQKVKVPIEVATGKEAEKLLNLELYIHKRLINQDEAVKAVASAMRQYRAGLARKKGPIAAFLFIGPTGVGKTELAKTLAEIFFGSEDEMVRFDMGEYQDPKSIWNFIGSPDGQIVGNLTESVKKKPFSVLLLDEFEKAHNDILELFLPLFDEGRLSDSFGNV
ncbi:MAG: AAA family ATPase, partial [Candidatus Paceibacteria bacterium]